MSDIGKQLLRSLWDFQGTIPHDRLEQNFKEFKAALDAGASLFRLDDARLGKRTVAHWEKMGQAPSISPFPESTDYEVLQARIASPLEGVDEPGQMSEVEVVVRLREILALDTKYIYTRTNYAFVCGRWLEECRRAEITGRLKEVSKLLQESTPSNRVPLEKAAEGRQAALAVLADALKAAGRVKVKPPIFETFEIVLSRWKTEGPLVHEPTGLDAWDTITGDGPVYGTRIYLLGAPDAGKTLVQAQLAHVWAQRDIAVGILAVDEESSDLTTRFAQRVGCSRYDCERREAADLARMADVLRSLPVRMYGPETTIEEASKDLGEWAKTRETAKAALFVDSIQLVSSDALGAANREPSIRERINANVVALRRAATEYRLIAIATSEMNRAAYRDIETAESLSDLAAGKESGAIEYSARQLLALRSVKDHPNLVQVRMAKNKHGVSFPSSPLGEFYWSVDRGTQNLSGAEAPPKEEKGGTQDPKFVSQCREVLQIILDRPDIGNTKLECELGAKNIKMGKDKVQAILTRLEKDGKIVDSPQTHGKRVDHHWRALVDADDLREAELKPNGVAHETMVTDEPYDDAYPI